VEEPVQAASDSGTVTPEGKRVAAFWFLKVGRLRGASQGRSNIFNHVPDQKV